MACKLVLYARRQVESMGGEVLRVVEHGKRVEIFVRGPQHTSSFFIGNASKKSSGHGNNRVEERVRARGHLSRARIEVIVLEHPEWVRKLRKKKFLKDYSDEMDYIVRLILPSSSTQTLTRRGWLRPLSRSAGQTS